MDPTLLTVLAGVCLGFLMNMASVCLGAWLTSRLLSGKPIRLPTIFHSKVEAVGGDEEKDADPPRRKKL